MIMVRLTGRQAIRPSGHQEAVGALTVSPTAPLTFVVMRRVILDAAEQVEDPRLLAPIDVLSQRLSDCRLLGSQSADSLSFFKQLTIRRQVRRHRQKILH